MIADHSQHQPNTSSRTPLILLVFYCAFSSFCILTICLYFPLEGCCRGGSSDNSIDTWYTPWDASQFSKDAFAFSNASVLSLPSISSIRNTIRFSGYTRTWKRRSSWTSYSKAYMDKGAMRITSPSSLNAVTSSVRPSSSIQGDGLPQAQGSWCMITRSVTSYRMYGWV